MQNDFKENYIEQQKRLAAERKARLAKIGMGGDASVSVRGQTVSKRPSVGAPVQDRQSTRPANGAQQPVSRPTPAMTRTASTAQVQRPASQTRPAPMQNPPAQRPASAPAQRTAANPSAIHRPSANGTAPAPAQNRPMQKTAPVSGSSRPASYGGYNQRRKPAPDENELFKKELSDNESRAMMFALTGRAEQPDDGGDVDIINMGRIRAPKREKEEDTKKKSNVGRNIGRAFAVLGLLLAFVIVFVFSSVALIAHGPSVTVRDLLVQSAEQTSAAKWVPYLFLDAKTVEAIINKSEETVKDIVSMDDYVAAPENEITEDEWANAKDGMIYKTVSGEGYKAYVLLIKDPSRVFVGTAMESLGGKPSGDNIFHITEFYNAVAAINGGEFPDDGGSGTGYTPIGITYSKGKCVYDDGKYDRTFLGITKDNKLVVNEGMTKKQAEELGIRDGVCFQKGNTLIQQKGEALEFYYQDGNTGRAQRTGIGQRADGTIILVVTDGRTGNSPGATHNNMIDLMVSFGAVNAGLLDGGSSSLMYYKDYYEKYGYDYEKLDEYQKKGLVNKYKAFTKPRNIPTFFIVSAE